MCVTNSEYIYMHALPHAVNVIIAGLVTLTGNRFRIRFRCIAPPAVIENILSSWVMVTVSMVKETLHKQTYFSKLFRSTPPYSRSIKKIINNLLFIQFTVNWSCGIYTFNVRINRKTLQQEALTEQFIRLVITLNSVTLLSEVNVILS